MLYVYTLQNSVNTAYNEFMAKRTPSYLSALQLIGFVFVCQAAGSVGSLFTFSAIPNWYAYLNKPFFSPPNWVFGPVWTLLYTMMGIAAYLVWKKGKGVSFWFWLQLGLNTLWSILFFRLHNPTLAFFEIILLWLAIFLSIKAFYQRSKTAAYLLVPYLLWVTFATLLNASIAILN